MKFVCNREILNDCINTVQKAISSKSTMPILECIKIEAGSDGNVVFTGNNLELCIEYNIECNVMESGEAALTSKMLGEIIRRMPDGDILITVNESNNITTIKNGLSEFNIQGLSSNDYPAVPIIDEKFRLTIAQKTLKKLIRKTISFVAVNEVKKPNLAGELFEIKNNTLNVVSSDSRRLAVVREHIETDIENEKLIIPGNTLRELLKILKDGDETVDIIVSDRHALFDFGYYQVYTMLFDGDFLKYEAIISAVNTISAVVDKRVVMESLERAMLLINENIALKTENKAPVKFNVSDDRIDISCIAAKGQVNDTIDALVEGGDILIGFNCRFMLDALMSCDEEKIKLEFNTPTSGCFIRSAEDDDSFVYMVLPVRLYN